MNGYWLIFLIWFGVAGGMLVYYRRDLLALWSEPVLRHPVMIIESDDWGAGPVGIQADVLNRLVDVLSRYHDKNGRHPVMTLALVLAVPDGRAISQDGQYHRILLDDPLFLPLLQAIDRGRAAGVFALQLHGLEHYWPEALMASTDPSVKAWLTCKTPGKTEALPSHLQSRWVDASVLPSSPLGPESVSKAVAEEVSLFERIFGEKPRVAVPPTFVWTADVERAWAKGGVEFVVTPGLRSACRDETGLPNCDTGPFRNGQPGSDVIYIVRDDYFEPERGHKAERALEALDIKTEQGRVCLLETHRSNFIGDPSVADDALNEIDRLLALANSQYAQLHFLSTEEFGRAMLQSDPRWVDQRLLPHISAWLSRIRKIQGFWRLSRVIGLAWIMIVMQQLARITLARS